MANHETHPAADLFPMLDDKELRELAEDIKQHGLVQPIVRMWVADPVAPKTRKPLILDGRNRLRACEIAKVKPAFVDYGGDDPVGHVLSLNLKRRHLSTSQRASLAARAAELRAAEGKAKREENLLQNKGSTERTNLSHRTDPHTPSGRSAGRGSSVAQAAAEVNVSEGSVKAAALVQKKGLTELAAMVERDEVSVSAAAAVAKLPKKEQRKIVKRGPDAVREAAKAAREQKTTTRRRAPSTRVDSSTSQVTPDDDGEVIRDDDDAGEEQPPPAAEKQEPAAFTDADGRDVPEELVPLFRFAGPLREDIARAIHEAERATERMLEELARVAPGMGKARYAPLHKSLERTQARLHEAAFTAKHLEPWVICTGCEGAGCGRCDQGGWLSKPGASSARRGDRAIAKTGS